MGDKNNKSKTCEPTRSNENIIYPTPQTIAQTFSQKGCPPIYQKFLGNGSMDNGLFLLVVNMINFTTNRKSI
ncbi:hypothetical protein EZS27_007050 [termite gut metagenome]|uniref:Uncharacterized protein n=1 Tax=termite gut metagenome TaxID=433724 RepID=A0A5J4SJ60_9ZZZZ